MLRLVWKLAATKAALSGGLDPPELGRSWRQHGERVRARELEHGGRDVVASDYVASCRDDLAGVFAALDELADELPTHEAEPAN